MITLEELDKLVKEEFKDYMSTITEWDKKKNNLLWGGFSTYIDELALFCWKCGCSFGSSQDYWDGDITCDVWIPETEDEYQKNIKDGTDWWEKYIKE